MFTKGVEVAVIITKHLDMVGLKVASSESKKED